MKPTFDKQITTVLSTNGAVAKLGFIVAVCVAVAAATMLN
jgi:hypothetical protein